MVLGGMERKRNDKVEAMVQAPLELGKNRLKGSRGWEASVRGKQWNVAPLRNLCGCERPHQPPRSPEEKLRCYLGLLSHLPSPQQLP